jgi:hypothetical protein
MVRRGRLECGGIEPRSDQTKDYTIGICCFSAKHAALRSKSKDWLARNQNNVSGWSDMSPGELLFQWASAYRIPTQRTSSSSHWKLTWYSWKIAELALNNNHSLTHSLTHSSRHTGYIQHNKESVSTPRTPAGYIPQLFQRESPDKKSEPPWLLILGRYHRCIRRYLHLVHVNLNKSRIKNRQCWRIRNAAKHIIYEIYGYALVELQKFYDDEHNIFYHDLEITVECLDLLYIHMYLKSKQACRINRSHTCCW